MKNWKIASTLALALALGGPLLAGAAEVFGKPLRGLSPVAIESLKKDPERYRERTVRIGGIATTSEGGAVTISDGAALQLTTDGGFQLPKDLAGASVKAEGRLANPQTFVATGVEITR